MANFKNIMSGTVSSLMNKAKEVAEDPKVREMVEKAKIVAEDTVSKVKDATEGSTVKEVYDQGAAKVKALGQQAKLNLELNGNYDALRELYAEIGELYFETHQHSYSPEFEALFAETETLLQDICEMEQALNAMKSAPAAEEDITVEIVAEEADSPFGEIIEEVTEEFKEAVEEFKEVVEATEEKLDD